MTKVALKWYSKECNVMHGRPQKYITNEVNESRSKLKRMEAHCMLMAQICFFIVTRSLGTSKFVYVCSGEMFRSKNYYVKYRCYNCSMCDRIDPFMGKMNQYV